MDWRRAYHQRRSSSTPCSHADCCQRLLYFLFCGFAVCIRSFTSGDNFLLLLYFGRDIVRRLLFRRTMKTEREMDGGREQVDGNKKFCATFQTQFVLVRFDYSLSVQRCCGRHLYAMFTTVNQIRVCSLCIQPLKKNVRVQRHDVT